MSKIRAYMMFKVTANKADEVTQTIRKLRSVLSADSTSGPYDVIAITEAEDINEIADLVVREISEIHDITAVETCLSVKTI